MTLPTVRVIEKVEIYKYKMADDHHIANSIIATDRPILTKFCSMTHVGPLESGP